MAFRGHGHSHVARLGLMRGKKDPRTRGLLA